MMGDDLAPSGEHFESIENATLSKSVSLGRRQRWGGGYTHLCYGTSWSMTYSGSLLTSPSGHNNLQIVYDAVGVWLSSRKLTLNALKTCLFFSHGNALPGWTLLLTLIQSILLCPLRFTSSALLMTKILNVRSTRKQNVSLRNLLSLRPIAVYANLLATTVNASDLSTSPPLIPYSIMAALFGYLPSKPNLVKSH